MEKSNLSDEIRRWGREHKWYHIHVQTNQGKLDQRFGAAIDIIARQLDTHEQPKLRRGLLDCWDHLTAKCMKIDAICRAGCRSEKEMLELEFLRSKAIGAAYELAEVLELLGNQQFNEECRIQNEEVPQTPKSSVQWITFGEAANILGVTKSTVSKWRKKGKLEDNGLTGQKKRLRKVSVLLLKNELEEKELRQDAGDLRRDSMRILNS